MIITFLTMYNTNHFFYKTHENYKNINLRPELTEKLAPRGTEIKFLKFKTEVN